MFKTLLFYVTCLLFCTSCSYRYQVFEVDSAEVKNLEEDAFFYEDERLEIVYDFWSRGGLMMFQVFNKTEEPIQLDLSQSQFQINGTSFNYFAEIQKRRRFAEFGAGEDDAFLPDRGIREVITIRSKEGRWIEGFMVQSKYRRPKHKTTTLLFEPKNSPIQISQQLAISSGKRSEIIDHNFSISSIEWQKQSQFRKDRQAEIFRPNQFYTHKEALIEPSEWLYIGLDVLATIALY